MLGKTESKRKRGQQRMRCLDGITDSMDTNLVEVEDRGAWGVIDHEVAESDST